MEKPPGVVSPLNVSSLKTNMDDFSNSVDPDDMAHNKPSRRALHCAIL